MKFVAEKKRCRAGLVLVAVLVPPDWKLLLAAGLVLATGGPTLPPLLNRLLTRMQTRTHAPDQPTAEMASIGWRTIGVGWAAMLALWLLLGWSVMIVLSGLSEAAPSIFRLFLLCTAAVSLATVAGFLSLLPGGLVVRELILLELLAPQVGEPTALVAAVLLRLVWLVSELAVSGILYFAAAPSKT